jgi:hypothetical protein
MVRPPIVAALRCRLPGIEKLGNGGDKLGRRKRLGQKDAVGNPLRAPIVCTVAGHVDGGKFRVDLSGALGDLPAVHPVSPEISVGHQRAEFAPASGQQGDSLFTRRGDSRFETALRKSVFDDALNRICQDERVYQRSVRM